ncbi:blue-light-inducible Bli-3 protein [Pseudohyphozyma bogoriensis]|nr:blue-light-inducible Bli-3 protein [Pseudohyphozyma bogoriensis]
MAEQAQSTPTAAGPAAQSHTALRTNLTYLIKGPANAAAHPASLRTRSILRTTRYVLKFVFWRLVRYFKYALVGAGVAALAGTFGATMLPWVAAVAVPSVPMAAALGLGTAVVKAASDASPATKLKEVKNIMKDAKFSMLTTVSPTGDLHSRAMTPASHAGLVFQFIGNTDSGKFDDVVENPKVNISWSVSETTDWVSASGHATVLKDAATLKDLWSPAIKSWFGDLTAKDPRYTGNWDDPRVAVIQVVPTEIRYWHKTVTKAGMAYQVVKGAVTGETAAPGELRVIGAEELKLARELDDKEL